MSKVDELLREGLLRATDPVEDLSTEVLAQRLATRRARSEEPVARWWGRPMTLVAALLLVVATAAVGWSIRDRGVRQDVVVDAPTTTTVAPTSTVPRSAPVGPAPGGPVEGWAPGWYQLDASALPTLARQAVWFRGELYVTAAGTGTEVGTTQVFRRDQDSGEWSVLPSVELLQATLVAAGNRLVAVGEEGAGAPPLPRGWVVLSNDGDSWQSMGRVRPDPTRASSSYIGPRLVWTGERVLDTTGAAVLDPATGTATRLEVPDEEALVLTFGATVWTGERAVLATWGPEPGYAWDARGRFLGELPPAANDALGPAPSGSQPVQAAVTVVDGSVLAVAAPSWSSSAVGRQLLPGSDRWGDAAAPPVAPLVGDVNLFTQCRSWLGAAGPTVLSLACNAAGSRSAQYRDGGWAATAVPELLGTSTIEFVEGADHAVTVHLSVPPPPDVFAGPTPGFLVWVPPR